MGVFRKPFPSHAKPLRVTRARLPGNAGEPRPRGRKILPLTASIAGPAGRQNSEKPTFYWLSGDGMALADL
jgi:hypothetical protein